MAMRPGSDLLHFCEGAAMSYEFVSLSTYGKVLLVTLNRPDVHNAMHAPMHAELSDVWDGFAANPEPLAREMI